MKMFVAAPRLLVGNLHGLTLTQARKLASLSYFIIRARRLDAPAAMCIYIWHLSLDLSTCQCVSKPGRERLGKYTTNPVTLLWVSSKACGHLGMQHHHVCLITRALGATTTVPKQLEELGFSFQRTLVYADISFGASAAHGLHSVSRWIYGFGLPFRSKLIMIPIP